ncbi:MAG: hypothetical protein JF595_13995 [Sphingomonadales bacterium]|nr:hypothetical protein [Sphingomonadales bacterium]
MLLPAVLIAVSAEAQVPGSVEDFHLPPAPTPSPTAAGPVDSDHPVAAPTTPAPTPPPTPAPAATLAPSPVIALPAPTAPRAERSPPAQVRPGPTASPTAISSAPAPAVTPASPPAAEPVPMPATATPASPPLAPAPSAAYWPWLAGAAVLVMLAGAFLLRRHTTDEDALEDEPIPAQPADVQPASGPPDAPPPPRRGPTPPPLAIPPRPLDMQLEARHLSRAMINATLAYRLTLTNRAETATGPLRIAGDIVSAHASLSAQEQLAPGDAALAAIHEVPSLAPGESLSLSGELRLPLASILPIHSGTARVFVPLARFRTETQDGAATTRVFVIGQASGEPGGALRPFLLDRGPGVDRALDQRELDQPQLKAPV